MIKTRKNYQMLALTLSVLLAAQGTAVKAAEDEPVQEGRNVVITASRTEQEVKDTPSAVTVITAEDIKAKGAVTLRQALENEGGISFTIDQGSRSGVSLRGMESRHTLILVDGRRLSGENGMESENGAQMIDRISLENVERIEIVKGPGSTLYGSDAIGGVINIITKKPEKQQWLFNIEGALEDGSSHLDPSYYLRYDAGTNGKFAWTLGAGERKSNDYSISDDVSNFYGTRRPIDFKAIWKPDISKTLTFDFNWLDEELQRKGGTSKYSYDTERTDFSLNYEVKGQAADYQVQAYTSLYDKDYESRTSSSGTLNSFDVLRHRISAIEGKSTAPLSDNHLLTVGAEYRWDSLKGTRIDTGEGSFTEWRDGVSADGSETTLEYQGLYLQDEWQVNHKMLIIPSLRYDNSGSFGDAWTPKLGMTYKLNDNNRLKASVGKGYKAPTASELYNNWTHVISSAFSYRIGGNPDLKPERSESYELTWETDHGPRNYAFTYFHSDVKNLIDYELKSATYYPSVFLDYSYYNVDRADIQGFETSVKQQLSERLSTKLNYTYLDAVDGTTGDRLTNRAKNQVGVSLNYADPGHRLNVSLAGTWRGDYLNSSSKIKTFSTWDFMLNKELNDKVTYYLGADNFTNYVDEESLITGAVYRTGLKIKF